MLIEMRLKKILRDHGLDRRRITQDIAHGCNVHRHTIGKLYRNQLSNPSLKVLGDLCDWLQSNGVPAAELPHALFGLRPSKLWEAVAGPGKVTLYLGEYQQTVGEMQPMLWISRRDATVAGEIIQKLSRPAGPDGTRRFPTVRTEYVPFHLCSREKDRAVPSCFGGAENPPGCKGPFEPGILYLDARGSWVRCPWKPGEEDAGILILTRDPGTESLEMALFGFSGKGTEALGWHLAHGSDEFWPPYVDFKGRQVGVYVCRVNIGAGIEGDDAREVRESKADKDDPKPEGKSAGRSAGRPTHTRQPQVVKMDPRVLKKFLA